MANNQIDYSKEYFTIVALEDGLTAQFSHASYYRIDNGEWISLHVDTATPSINKGQKISFKITIDPTIYESIGVFTVNKAFNAEGNIMSLIYGDNFEGQIDLSGKYYVFAGLFYDCVTLQSAENLILPATTLSDFCYKGMFQDCTSLTSAPELPATTLAMNCYVCMFAGCTSLTSTPELPATTLVDECYIGMFNGCSKLNYIKMLATNVSAVMCLSDWVIGVASSGTFIKNAAMTSLPSGTSGIPTGWTVKNYNENENMGNKKFLDGQGLTTFYNLLQVKFADIIDKLNALYLDKVTLSVSVSPPIIKKNTSNKVTVTATVKNIPDNFTLNYIKINDIETILNENKGSLTETISLELNTKKYSVEADIDGTKFTGSVNLNARHSIYYGYDTPTENNLPANGLSNLKEHDSTVTSAKMTYQMKQEKEGSYPFFILIPDDITTIPTQFSMNNTNFAMTKVATSHDINGIKYVVFKSGGTYSTGKELKIIAS